MNILCENGSIRISSSERSFTFGPTGTSGFFYRREITYYEEGGLVYWTMGAPLEETTIINRCKKEDSFEYRSRNGTLPRAAGPLK